MIHSSWPSSKENDVMRDMRIYIRWMNSYNVHQRMEFIHNYVEWLLDETRNLGIKKDIGFSNPQYITALSNLFEEKIKPNE